VVQAPLPSQTEDESAVVAFEQVAAVHTVSAPLYTHESDVPSQVPPQVTSVAVQGVWPERGAPDATRTQAPLLSHTWHWPVQADSQHTPSAQKPVVHSSLLVQVAPGAFLATHRPAVLQNNASPQEPDVQLPAHLPLPSLAHWPLGHGPLVGCVQAPLPSQTEAGVAMPAAHLEGVHTVVPSGNAQTLPLVPSQRPLQPPDPAHAVRGVTGAPLTATHLPGEPLSLHDSH
jgi:hypothetical protein